MVRADETTVLPWAWYCDQDVLLREHDRIFDGAWQYVGHTGQVRQPGDLFPARIGRVPIVVARDGTGELRGLVNVCRHRGSLLVEKPGNRRTLQCPYHAWTYGLDGKLLAAPRSELEAGFEASELSLVRVRVGSWGPFVFANTDRQAISLDAWLGRLPELVADAGLDVDDLRFHHRAEYEVSANWKIVCENFLECYHCPVAHPEFSALVDVSPGAYGVEVDPTFSSQFAPVRAEGGAYDAAGEVSRGQFHLLWPNTGINIFPGRPNLSIGPMLPAGAGTTSRFLDYFFAPDVAKAWVDELLAFDDQVGREDVALVERVQAGVAAGMPAAGRLLVTSERLVADFQARVRQALGDE